MVFVRVAVRVHVHWNTYSQLPLLAKVGKYVFAPYYSLILKRHMSPLFIISSRRNYSQLEVKGICCIFFKLCTKV